MLCKISDLFVEIPATGGLASRCREYLTDEKLDGSADIIIRADRFNPQKWEHLSEEENIYLQSGSQFYRQLLDFDGLMLHSSAVEFEGKAYLFSGPSGMGKSTHTRLWQQAFGSRVNIFNDDKPALRRLEDGWYAYGTPWCGKDGININMKVPIAGICFLKRGNENQISRLSCSDAIKYTISQTIRRFKEPISLDSMLYITEKLVNEIPVYEFFNKPEPDAARISFETMSRGAMEINYENQ